MRGERPPRKTYSKRTHGGAPAAIFPSVRLLPSLRARQALHRDIVVLLANCATLPLALTKIRQGGFAFALHMATTK